MEAKAAIALIHAFGFSGLHAAVLQELLCKRVFFFFFFLKNNPPFCRAGGLVAPRPARDQWARQRTSEAHGLACTLGLAGGVFGRVAGLRSRQGDASGRPGRACRRGGVVHLQLEAPRAGVAASHLSRLLARVGGRFTQCSGGRRR